MSPSLSTAALRALRTASRLSRIVYTLRISVKSPEVTVRCEVSILCDDSLVCASSSTRLMNRFTHSSMRPDIMTSTDICRVCWRGFERDSERALVTLKTSTKRASIRSVFVKLPWPKMLRRCAPRSASSRREFELMSLTRWREPTKLEDPKSTIFMVRFISSVGMSA
ncbi:hypothetical protein B484DRAFT_455800 [Ochromonadaceae sp. CCMP2298]|nr:hypothetical protein B484DRAFT_455800 [Ochromonadaceae sp. CCMP2298]